MDKFSFFFAFYGLILGLAVTELLSGFASMVRDRALKQLEPQTALLAALTFVIICATWIDAWNTGRSVTLDLAGLWAPILIGTCYYLAAAVIFPRDAKIYATLGDYYRERKRFVVLMLVIAELLVSFTYRNIYYDLYQDRPAVLWLWQIPYKVTILGAFMGIWLARTRLWNNVWLVVTLLLFTTSYWQYASVREAISRFYGY